MSARNTTIDSCVVAAADPPSFLSLVDLGNAEAPSAKPSAKLWMTRPSVNGYARARPAAAAFNPSSILSPSLAPVPREEFNGSPPSSSATSRSSSSILVRGVFATPLPAPVLPFV